MLKYAFELYALSNRIFDWHIKEENIVYVSHFLYINLKFSKLVLFGLFLNLSTTFNYCQLFFSKFGKSEIAVWYSYQFYVIPNK